MFYFNKKTIMGISCKKVGENNKFLKHLCIYLLFSRIKKDDAQVEPGETTGAFVLALPAGLYCNGCRWWSHTMRCADDCIGMVVWLVIPDLQKYLRSAGTLHDWKLGWSQNGKRMHQQWVVAN